MPAWLARLYGAEKCTAWTGERYGVHPAQHKLHFPRISRKAQCALPSKHLILSYPNSGLFENHHSPPSHPPSKRCGILSEPVPSLQPPGGPLQPCRPYVYDGHFDNFSPNVKRTAHTPAGSARHVPRLVRMGQEVVRWPTICLEGCPMYQICVSEP